MFIRLQLLLMVWVLPAWLLAQPEWVQEFQLSEPHDFFELDQHGNIYLVQGHKLSKWSAQGRQLHQYSDPLLANIDAIDLLDPLSILVNYKNENKVLRLDPQLVPIGAPQFLEPQGVLEPSSVAASVQYHLWFFHPTEQAWMAMDKHEEVVSQTKDLSLFEGSYDTPSEAVEHHGHLFVSVPHMGVCLFDRRGALLHRYEFEHVAQRQFQLYQKQLLVQQNQRLVIIDLESQHYSFIELPDSARQFRKAPNGWYLSDGQTLKRYIQQP